MNRLTNNGLCGWKAPVYLPAPHRGTATRLGARFEYAQSGGMHQILPLSCNPHPREHKVSRTGTATFVSLPQKYFH